MSGKNHFGQGFISFLVLMGLAACGTTQIASVQSGRQIASLLLQRTGVTERIDSQSIADPAPPYINRQGEIEIYGSGPYFMRYKTWAAFRSGGPFELVNLDLRYPNGAKPTIAPEWSGPWDVRKYLVNTPVRSPEGQITGYRSDEVMIGGWMNREDGKTPMFPRDNPSRRLYFMREKNGRWVRDKHPIVRHPYVKFPQVEAPSNGPNWLGHSYGGNLFQEGMPNAYTLRADLPLDLFFEQVVTPPAPDLTEIYRVRLTKIGPTSETAKPLIEILRQDSADGTMKMEIKGTERSIGGRLIEGPRPFTYDIGGVTYYFIAFSSGDFTTDGYGTHFAWSKSFGGPFEALKDENGALRDFGVELKKSFGLSWLGRPSPYVDDLGQARLLFHGVEKNDVPDNDYSKWPTKHSLAEFFRSIYDCGLKIHLDEHGTPQIELQTGTKTR